MMKALTLGSSFGDNTVINFSRRSFVVNVGAGLVSTSFGTAFAEQKWQATKPIHLIVPYPPGGPTDIVARVLSQQIGSKLGQPIVVDNKPGASGSIGAQLAWMAAPDGHTLLIGASDTNCIYPHVYSKPIFKAEDFVAFAPVGSIPHVLMARPDFEGSTAKDVIAMAKKKQLTYSSWGTGSTGHLAMVIFARNAGLPAESLLHVPYQGAAPAAQAVLVSQVDLMFAPVPMVVAQGGKLKPIAVMMPKRVEAVPNIPTFDEQGVPMKTDADIWMGLMLPPKTPGPIVKAYAARFDEAMKSPEVQAKLSPLGIVPGPVPTPKEYAAWYEDQFKRWGKVIHEAGIRLE
jgi:tripartite-type tricarboxylate transporter receptor subunit TctC